MVPNGSPTAAAYLLAFVAVHLTLLLLRAVLVTVPARRALREREGGAEYATATLTTRDLSPVELGYLVGGPKRALLAALPGASPDESEPAQASPLTRQLRAMGTGTWGIEIDDILYTCRESLAALHESLECRGLALSPKLRNTVAGRNVVLDVVWLVVALPLLFGAGSFGFRLPALVALWAATAVFAGLNVALRCRNLHVPEAVRLVRSAKNEYAYLDPRNAPAYESYGPSSVPLAAALFGGAALVPVKEIAWLPAYRAIRGTQQFHPRQRFSTELACGVAGAKGCGGDSCSGWDLALGPDNGTSSCGNSGVS